MKAIRSKLSGQIMVIILLILSILSVIALTATLNTSRDTQEQQQNKEYQQYYAVGERKMMDIVQALGKIPVGTAANTLTLSDTNFVCSTGCTTGDMVRTYVAPTILPTNYNTAGTQENLQSSITVTDLQKIDATTPVDVNKDQDILLNISGNTGTVTFKWTNGDVVAWNISYDYKTGGGADYKTDKFVWNKLPGGPYATDTSAGGTSDQGCFNITGNSAAGLVVTYNGAACATPLFLRLKPVTTASSVTINYLEIAGNTQPLARKITSATTSATSGGTGNAANPSAVLDTTYLLTVSPLSLFDYVLRSEGSVVKN
jgi:hypothetical protein